MSEFEKERNSLLIDVSETLEKYDKKKDHRRTVAIVVRVTVSVLGAFITVVLGWKYENKTDCPKNVALILGAAITFINSIDSFVGFTNQWTKYKNICTQLKQLNVEILYVKDNDTDALQTSNGKLEKIKTDAVGLGIKVHD